MKARDLSFPKDDSLFKSPRRAKTLCLEEDYVYRPVQFFAVLLSEDLFSGYTKSPSRKAVFLLLLVGTLFSVMIFGIRSIAFPPPLRIFHFFFLLVLMVSQFG